MIVIRFVSCASLLFTSSLEFDCGPSVPFTPFPFMSVVNSTVELLNQTTHAVNNKNTFKMNIVEWNWIINVMLAMIVKHPCKSRFYTCLIM